MNNTLTVSEIKRRGMAAIEEGLMKGPVQIIKRNKPAAVVLNQQDYERLTRQASSMPTVSALDWLLSHPPGNLSPDEIDAWMREERSW
jgi:hypothetical protein